MSQPLKKKRRTLRNQAEITNEAPSKENRSPKSKFKVGGASQGLTASSTDRSPSKHAKLTRQDAAKKGPLDRFVQPATNSPSHGAAKGGASPRDPVEEDAIQDDFSDDEMASPPADRTRLVANASSASRASKLRPSIAKAGAYAGRVKAQSSDRREGKGQVLSPVSLPWSEAYAPQDSGELAVHKSKVEDVRKWLTNVVGGRERKRLLVLDGPSGAGKSTTVHVLANELDLQVIEWTNAVTMYSTGTLGYESMVSRFDEFLNRSGSYSSLVVNESTNEEPEGTRTNVSPGGRQKVIVVEEFPITLPFKEESLKAFRASLLQFLASTLSNSTIGSSLSQAGSPVPTPLVMIISESRAGASASGSDGFTAYRLLGNDLLRHPAVTNIGFNPMASTFIIKALGFVTRKEARHSSRRRVPGREVLQALSELGDLRSAIGSLELLCKKGGKDGDWSGRVAAVKAGKPAPTRTELDVIRTIALRGSTISLFHAAGKVLYNKRTSSTPSPSGAARPAQPPGYLEHHARLNTSEINIGMLMDDTGADTGTFIATLHENLAWSCCGDREVDTLDECLGVLSDSDILAPDSSRHVGGQAGGRAPWANKDAVDFLLQDEITFRTATCGLLFFLPFPVQRSNATQSRAKNSDAWKMYYPTSLRLWKRLEECKSMISSHTSRLLQETTTTADAAEQGPHGVHDRSSRLLDELAQERLPYLYKIRRSKGNTLGIADLETVTQFKGLNVGGGDDDDSLEEPGSYRTFFTNVEAANPDTSQLTPLQGANTLNDMQALAHNLILSDDDIEDV